MSDKSNLAIGAGVGAVAGAGAGYLQGNFKATQILGKLKGQAKDVYVNSRLEANLDNLTSMYSKSNMQLDKAWDKIAKAAGENFDKLTNLAKSTKVKWIAGVAAAGTAIGLGVAAIVNKIKANKAE